MDIRKYFFLNSKPKEIENEYLLASISQFDFLKTLKDIDIFPKFYYETPEGNEFLGFGSIPNSFESPYLFLEKYLWHSETSIEHRKIQKITPKLLVFKFENKFYFLLKENLTVFEKNGFELKLNKRTENSFFPLIQKSKTLPEYHEWLYLFQKIPWDSIQKVVLARKKEISLSDNLETYNFFKKVHKKNQSNFYLSLDPSTTFLGSSPESLIRIQNGEFYTESIAGTAPIEKKADLLQSEKDLKEQGIVTQSILDILKKYSNEITIQDPQLKESKNLAHIKTALFGEIKNLNPSNLENLIFDLSPTPAICGTPRPEALDFLKENEKFDRNFYSSPFGIVLPEYLIKNISSQLQNSFESNFYCDICVAIRSAFIQTKHITLYSGAGIVKESSPEKEWEELDYKIKPFMDLLV